MKRAGTSSMAKLFEVLDEIMETCIHLVLPRDLCAEDHLPCRWLDLMMVSAVTDSALPVDSTSQQRKHVHRLPDYWQSGVMACIIL
jgi:hypothetical protein